MHFQCENIGVLTDFIVLIGFLFTESSAKNNKNGNTKQVRYACNFGRDFG